MDNLFWIGIMNTVIPSFEVKVERKLHFEGMINVEAEIIHNGEESEKLCYSFTIDEFILQRENPIKEDLYYSLVIGGMHSEDADLIIANSVIVASDLVFAEEYCHKNTLTISFSVLSSVIREGSSIDFERAVEESINIAEVKYQPASKHALEYLEVKIYENNQRNSQEDCVICLENFSVGDEMIILKCGHRFGRQCIVKWLNTSHVCPVCRFKLL